ncbi:MAG: LPS biosynthesis protein WbpP, partial [Actinomycetota bacterium]
PFGGEGQALGEADLGLVAEVTTSAPAANCSGKAYNVAGGHRHSLLDLIAALEDCMGNSPGRTHVDPRPGDVRHSEADIGAARRDLGYEPKIGLTEGLALTAEWFKARQQD